MVGIYQRNLILPAKVDSHISDQHRLMHMDQVKLAPPEFLIDAGIQDIGDSHSVLHPFFTGAVPYDILLPVFVLIFRGEYAHFMSSFAQTLRKTLNGYGNASYKRLVIVCHHCDLHVDSSHSHLFL